MLSSFAVESRSYVQTEEREKCSREVNRASVCVRHSVRMAEAHSEYMKQIYGNICVELVAANRTETRQQQQINNLSISSHMDVAKEQQVNIKRVCVGFLGFFI